MAAPLVPVARIARAPHALQHSCGIIEGPINVHTCAPRSCASFLLASASDGDRPESHVSRKLNAEVSQAPNALHSDRIPGAQTGVAKGVVGRDARAEERRGLS